MFEGQKKKTLEKKGIYTDTDLCYVFPYKYCNYGISVPPYPEYDGMYVSVQGHLKYVSCKTTNHRSHIYAAMDTPYGRFSFSYFGQKQMEPSICALEDRDVTVCGKLKYDEQFGPSITNPDMVLPIEKVPGWFTKYSNFGKGKGKIKEDELLQAVLKAQKEQALPETIPLYILRKTGLPERRTSLIGLTKPENPGHFMNCVKRQVFEDMLYFACCMERDKRCASSVSPFRAKSRQTSEAIIKSLTYNLTDDQDKTYRHLAKEMETGKRVSCLVQGDVGYGKSITAFLLMFVMADSGYQSVIMAPTMILAEQHYAQLSQLAGKHGYKAAFLHGNLKAAEKKKIMQEIQDGSCQLIVGTHATVSDSVQFKQLGLVIIDEEQRFGVKQRQMLRDKAMQGVHSISMTATPIPRSIASSIYGGTNVIEIKTPPKGKKQVKTAVVKNDLAAMNFLKERIENGGQGYVICPLVDDERDDLKLSTVKETASRYESFLNTPVGIVTGKQDKRETSRILESFRNGKTKVLVGTTVLEVGVSVKDADVIIIEDAWMFGLSQLHQLRGRVGRGTKQGYCILVSSRPSESLQFLASTTDGFKIAEYDMRMRGGGNLMGEEQTGKNRYIWLSMRFPIMYKKAMAYARQMVDSGEDEILIRETEMRSEKAFLNFRNLQVYDMSGLQWTQILPKMS